MLKNSSDQPLQSSIKPNKGTGTFADNIFTLSGGATIALGVTILASPITSRLFDPEAFGLAALFRSGITLLGLISCLRYDMAIVLPKNDEDAAPLFAVCVIALLAVTTLTAILTLLSGHRIVNYLDAITLKPYLWLFPIYLFLAGSNLLLRRWHARHKRFKISATGNVLSSLSTSIGEITGGVLGFRTGANLVVIRFFGLFIAPVFLSWRLPRSEVRFIIQNINLDKIIQSAKQYKKFPLFSSFAIMATQLSGYAPIILLAAFFSPAVSGLYAKAIYLLQLPVLIIGRSVSQVFLQESAVTKAEGRNLSGLVEAVLNRMITLGTLPFAILAIIGPELFSLFLGARWAESGTYAQIMAPQLYLAFVSGSIITLFETLAKQEMDLASQFIGLIFRIGILIYGGLLWHDVHLTIFVLMVCNLLFILWRISFLFRVIGFSIARPLAHFSRCVAYAAPSVILVAGMKWWLGLESLYLVALTPICSIFYVIFILRHDLELRDLLFKNLRKIYAII